MKKTIVGLIAGLSLIFSASAAYAAFFSVGLDVPLQYSFEDGGSADDVSGFKATLSLPFFVGFGVENYTATVNSSSANTEVEFSFFDLFVNLPIPAIIIGLGVGVGSATVTQSPETTGLAFEDADLFQYFVTLGYPVFPLFDIHLGYHVVSGTSDVKLNGSKVQEANLDGTMLSLGISFGF